ncbi:MAG TPA: rRNA adenine N-6-methyltransferase family protein [Terracidiphilus sp.]|nr:rRNA adenine N-6-methyltransferase family protein [Terracidiphilus sp.]
MTTLETHRLFFAELITAKVGKPKSRLTSAFAATPRERYLGPGPWKIFTGRGYISTPSDDPALLYQDILVALEEELKINNGQPTLHALCLAALNVQEGETVVHIGAGTGYYTAVLAELVGSAGQVFAFEVEPELAQRASTTLADLPNVTVYPRSGAEAPLPICDVVYINAGATAPLDIWLDALRPSGRLLFPLTPDGAAGMPGAGGLLLITRVSEKSFDARFISPAMFVPCIGARDEATAKRLAEAFKRGDSGNVRSLRRKTVPDETCWCLGTGWWLSTSENS